MHNHKKIIVGIQARSTSKRLPGKVYASLGPTTVLKSVIDSVMVSIFYFNESLGRKTNAQCSWCLLIPKGDPIKKDFLSWCVEGPEDDVLTRYKLMSDQAKPDYIVRITADCPLIPSPSITNLIKVGLLNQYDYCANFFESDKLFRLVPDGYECEFFSRQMLEWADKNATEKKDREHVTTIMRTYPDWGKYGVILPYSNTGDKKLSVDTEADLERVRHEVESVEEARKEAELLFGKKSIHRF